MSVDELVGAMDAMNVVVAGNTASIEEMAADSTEVVQAIDSIASVSQANSAVAQEVTVATEEMSAQVEEVAASSQSLTQMAMALHTLMAKFKIKINIALLTLIAFFLYVN